MDDRVLSIIEKVDNNHQPTKTKLHWIKKQRGVVVVFIVFSIVMVSVSTYIFTTSDLATVYIDDQPVITDYRIDDAYNEHTDGIITYLGRYGLDFSFLVGHDDGTKTEITGADILPYIHPGAKKTMENRIQQGTFDIKVTYPSEGGGGYIKRITNGKDGGELYEASGTSQLNRIPSFSVEELNYLRIEVDGGGTTNGTPWNTEDFHVHVTGSHVENVRKTDNENDKYACQYGLTWVKTKINMDAEIFEFLKERKQVKIMFGNKKSRIYTLFRADETDLYYYQYGSQFGTGNEGVFRITRGKKGWDFGETMQLFFFIVSGILFVIGSLIVGLFIIIIKSSGPINFSNASGSIGVGAINTASQNNKNAVGGAGQA